MLVFSTYTVPLYRPVAQSWVPSGLSCIMSGLPPPGIDRLATTLLVAKSITDIEPSRRLET